MYKLIPKILDWLKGENDYIYTAFYDQILNVFIVIALRLRDMFSVVSEYLIPNPVKPLQIKRVRILAETKHNWTKQ